LTKKNGKDELDLEAERIDAEIERLEKKRKLQLKKQQLNKLKADTGEISIMQKLFKMARSRI
jgi:hypothetical protein